MVAHAHRAELTFQCASASQANHLQVVLAAEQNDGPEGSALALRVEEDVLHASLQAIDLATLRAAINSVTRLADAALRTLA